MGARATDSRGLFSERQGGCEEHTNGKHAVARTACMHAIDDPPASHLGFLLRQRKIACKQEAAARVRQ